MIKSQRERGRQHVTVRPAKNSQPSCSQVFPGTRQMLRNRHKRCADSGDYQGTPGAAFTHNSWMPRTHFLLKIGEGQSHRQGCSPQNRKLTGLGLFDHFNMPDQSVRGDGAHTDICIRSTEGRCPQPWACMYLLWNRANRECINTTAQPDLGGWGSQATGDHASEAARGIKYGA